MFIYFDNKWKNYLKYLVFLPKYILCVCAHFEFQGYQFYNYFASAAVLCPLPPLNTLSYQ